jgi:hypothetical protein
MMPRSARTARPPTTPPTIAPTGVDDLVAADNGDVDAGMEDGDVGVEG